MTIVQRRVASAAMRIKFPQSPTQSVAWPRKVRDLRNHTMDSTVWDEFAFRPDDVVIASYAKAGTTWLQQIVAQLIFEGRDDIDVAAVSPWLDGRLPPQAKKLSLLAAQEHRRFIKTHLPVDALRFSPQAKYLYIGRDGRDVAWSLHNHHANYTEEHYRRLNDIPGRIGPSLGPPTASVRCYFLDWLYGDGYPFWSFWESVGSWWRIRYLPNVLLVHFADLKRDLAGETRRIAAFLDIPLDEATLELAERHSSFGHMKANAARFAPRNGRMWHGGARTFIHKGTNGRWRDVLTAEESRQYELMAEQRLGKACARWLAAGRLSDKGPDRSIAATTTDRGDA